MAAAVIVAADYNHDGVIERYEWDAKPGELAHTTSGSHAIRKTAHTPMVVRRDDGSEVASVAPPAEPQHKGPNLRLSVDAGPKGKH